MDSGRITLVMMFALATLLLIKCSAPELNNLADRTSDEFTRSSLLAAISAVGLRASVDALGIREGTPDQYSMSMAKAPAGTVHIDMSFDATQLIVNGSSVSPTRISFDAANWRTAQTISVAAVDDSITGGTRMATISHALAGASGGLVAPGDITITVRDNELRIYLTTSIYPGTFGGIAQADEACNKNANKPSGGMTWKAMISDELNRIACTTALCSGGASENTDWVMYSNVEYRRSDGVSVIGTTKAGGVFNFPGGTPPAPVIGISASALAAWTGLQFDWRADDDLGNCMKWTSPGTGTIGSTDQSNNTMIEASQNSCAAPRALYCVEQ